MSVADAPSATFPAFTRRARTVRRCPECGRTYPDAQPLCEADGAPLQAATSPFDVFVGKTLNGRYRVIEKLGEGGMGAVYRAEQVAIGKQIALKILRGEFARNEEFVRRFRQEARLAAATNHPNVIAVYDFDQTEDERLFIAMEYVDGTPLTEVLRRDGPIEVSRAVAIALQIAEGLAAAHKAGVIHRDVKPQNVMIVRGRDGVKLMDFGIARLREADPGARLTRVGVLMGTPEYMAPEQIEGGDVTEQTDIYSFGVVLYELLAGRPPFAAPTPGAVLAKHLRTAPVSTRTLRDGIPPALEQLVMRALEKRPELRHPSMSEVARGLREIERAMLPQTVLTPRAGSALPIPSGRGASGSLRRAALPLGVAALVVAGGLSWMLWSRPSGPRPEVRPNATGTSLELDVRPKPSAAVDPPLVPPESDRKSPVEDDREGQTAEAARKAEMERRRRAQEATRQAQEAARQADLERRRQEQATRSLEEEQRRQAEEEKRKAEEAARRAEEIRRQEAEEAARRQVEEEKRKAEEAARRAAEQAQARVTPSPPPALTSQELTRMRAQVEQKLRARGLLRESSADRWGVSVDLNPAGEATLAGTLRDATLYADSVKLVREVPGVKSVDGHNVKLSGSGPAPGSQPEQARLRSEIEQRLRRRGLLRESSTDRWGVSVDVNGDGDVVLTGRVRDAGLRAEAVRLARDAAGDREVRQNITLADRPDGQ